MGTKHSLLLLAGFLLFISENNEKGFQWEWLKVLTAAKH